MSAETDSSIHLNQLTISNKDFYHEKIEYFLEDVVLSSFSLFYLEESNKKYITANRFESAAPISAGNADSVDEGGTFGLNDLIEIALSKNRLLEVVKQQQAQSRGQLTQARSSYLPQLSVEGRYS